MARSQLPGCSGPNAITIPRMVRDTKASSRFSTGPAAATMISPRRPSRNRRIHRHHAPGDSMMKKKISDVVPI